MYTLEQLKNKSLKELKEIGWELNVLPENDRRYRESWINAIAGVNPPLLQLLETSPAVSVEQVQEPIIETVEISPAVEVDRAQEPPIESKFGRIVYPKSAAKPFSQNEEARPQLDGTECADVHNRRSHPTKSDRDSSGPKTETLGSQEGDRVLAVARHCETGRGRVLPDQSIELVNLTEADRLENEPRMSQSAIAQAVKTSPGVSRKTSTAHQLLDLFKSSAHIIEDSPASETEGEMLESTIAPAAENLPRSESDPNPILTGIVLSDKFLARYSPPQPENIHYQADADGQLSLLILRWNQ
jgi:hypothetical protein